MAKGLRASTKKTNKSLLRQNVFGPIEAARKERLSAKLLELASKSSPTIPADVKMVEVVHEEEEGVAQKKTAEINDVAKLSTDIDIHEDGSDTAVVSKRAKSSSSSSRKSSSGRVYKRGGRGKASATMTFLVYKDRKGAGGGRRKKMPRI